MSRSSDVFFSNSTDALLHILQSQLHDNQWDLPTSRTIIITPNQLVKKNLQKRLLETSSSGVVTGILFLEFAPAIVKFFRMVLGRAPKIPSKGLLSLELEKLLEDYSDDQKVRAYLEENPSSRIPALAETLSGLFLEYGKSARIDAHFLKTWQGRLFQQLFEEYDYPSRLMDASFEAPKVAHTLHFFGFQHIPAVYRRFLCRLEAFFTLYYYQLNPTPEYWGDHTKYADQVHPLLQSYGTLLRKTSDAITDLGFTTSDIYLQTKKRHALDHMKECLTSLDDTPIEPDDSIQLHATQTLARGIDVAYHIIAEKVSKGAAQPDEFLLLFTDLDTALPDIHRVFGNTEAPLPYQIYDVPSTQLPSSYRSLMVLLETAQGRVGCDEFLSLFEDGTLQEHFGIQGSDFHRIDKWLRTLHFRWGLSSQHRAFFIETDEEVGTLEYVLHSLAYAFMKPQLVDETSQLASIPFLLEGTDLPLLDALYTVYVSLTQLATWYHTSKTVSVREWKKRFYELLETLYGKSQAFESLERFIDASFEHIGQERVFSAQSMFRYLGQSLEKKKGIYGTSVLNGVTCAPLRTDSLLPQKYIFLFGLEEGVFPPTDSKNIFEVASLELEYSPSRLDDAAGCILSGLLHAHELLFLQYTEKNSEDGKEQELSHLIEPLLSLVPLPVKRHASTRFLDVKGAILPSTRKLAAAHMAQRAQYTFDPTFYAPQLPPPIPQKLWDVRILRQFLTHPLRAYTQHTLGMYLERETGRYEEKEFALHPLDRFRIRTVDAALHTGVLPTGPLKNGAVTRLREGAEHIQQCLSHNGIDTLYSVHFREDCKYEAAISSTRHIAPVRMRGEKHLHGVLEHVSGNTLVVFDTVKNAIRYWGDILCFGDWKKGQGEVLFLESNDRFTLPTEGLDQLLEYVHCAVTVPSPCLPNIVGTLLDDDASGFEKKIKQTAKGFPFEDPYFTLYVTGAETGPLFSKWQPIVTQAFSPYKRWVADARI